MIVIGDVGGTTTEWRVIHNGKIDSFKTIGINILHDSPSNLLNKIKSTLDPYLDANHVILYFAGLIEAVSRKRVVKKEVKDTFKKAVVEVENDMLAAARGMCMKDKGWVGILGTGANFGFYNGQNITERIPTLGYILGDEGSGSYMGKKLLADFARGRLPRDLDALFRKAYKLDESAIIEKTYNATESKAFLGSFSKFLMNNIQHPFCANLVHQSFIDHFVAMGGNYDLSTPVYYTGSVAYYFSDILKGAAQEMNIEIGGITETPIDGLTIYHKEYH